jgi:hypothetical protein
MIYSMTAFHPIPESAAQASIHLYPVRAVSLTKMKTQCCHSSAIERCGKERTHDGFNPSCHLLGGDTVGGLKPAARGSKNGPGRSGRPQSRIDAGASP